MPVEGRLDLRREDESKVLSQPGAGAMRSSSCRLRWRLRASVAPAVRRTLRRLFAVFGVVNVGHPSLDPLRLRLTWSVPASKFTSSHFKASSSPCRRPQWIASTYKAWSLSPAFAAARRKRRDCSGESDFTSSRRTCGDFTPAARLRGIIVRHNLVQGLPQHEPDVLYRPG